MINNRKKFVCVFLMMALLITGCGSPKSNKTMSYTYQVETGDNITVSLLMNDGYHLSSDVPFVISKDKETLSKGTFIQAEYYNHYIDSVKNNENAKIIDEGTKNNLSYMMWNYNGTEFNYVIMVEGTDTGILLGNNVSEEAAKECFKRLEIKVKE